jgi:protein-S-isoprenylcysteine O-methyltransferase Ste14
MRLYMDWGATWDLMFRSFLVFVFFGLLWLRFVDPVVPCMFGFPVPVLLALAYFYWGWRKARSAWFEQRGEGEAEV